MKIFFRILMIKVSIVRYENTKKERNYIKYITNGNEVYEFAFYPYSIDLWFYHREVLVYSLDNQRTRSLLLLLVVPRRI